MSLADQLELPDPAARVTRARTSHPKGWEPGHEWDGKAGMVNTGPVDGPRPTTWDAYLERSGLDPADVEVIEPVQVRGWQTYDERWLTYYKFDVQRRGGAGLPDLRQLYRAAKGSRMKAKTPGEAPVESAMVVLWADPQTGKVARRGGTPELIARAERYQADLADLARSRDWRCDAAYLLDLGDAVEGFESGGGPMASATTNDLSLMDQVDIATTVEFEAFKVLGQHHPRAVLAGVGSNHCRWRVGKQRLGNPGDDWGLHMLKQVHRRLGDSPEKPVSPTTTGPGSGSPPGGRAPGRTPARRCRGPSFPRAPPAIPRGGCRARRWTMGRTITGTRPARTLTRSSSSYGSPWTGGTSSHAYADRSSPWGRSPGLTSTPGIPTPGRYTSGRAVPHLRPSVKRPSRPRTVRHPAGRGVPGVGRPRRVGRHRRRERNRVGLTVREGRA